MEFMGSFLESAKVFWDQAVICIKNVRRNKTHHIAKQSEGGQQHPSKQKSSIGIILPLGGWRFPHWKACQVVVKDVLRYPIGSPGIDISTRSEQPQRSNPGS